MNLKLTNKERLLLQDQKNHEEICVQKYNDYANLASDPQLKALFKQNAQTEQEHLNTINQLLNSQIPSMNQGQGGGQQPTSMSMPQQQSRSKWPNHKRIASKAGTSPRVPNRSGSLHDMLMTEKYVSGTYDTAIFEFRDPVRQIITISKRRTTARRSDLQLYAKHGYV